MQKTVNVPIQMISCCNTLGDMTPMRFRYEDDEHNIITVQVIDVLSFKEINFSGNTELLYTCTANIYDMQHMFVLKYNIKSHRWLLFQFLQ